MKRILLVFIAAFALVSLTGCSEVIEDLNATVWETADASGLMTITFGAANCMIEHNYGEGRIDSYFYTYVAPAITMTPDDKSNPVLEGTVKGNLMTLTEKETQKEFGTFLLRK